MRAPRGLAGHKVCFRTASGPGKMGADDGTGAFVAVWGQVRADFAARRNIDVYVTIVASVAVGLLSVLDVVPESKVPGVTLGILGVLAFTALATRTAVDRNRAADAAFGRFTGHFPPELIVRREAAQNVYLIGLDMARTVDQSYGAFHTNLARGMKLRVLVTDPDADASALDAKHPRSGPDPVAQRAKIESTLRKLHRLRTETGGALEIRTTQVALTFGLNSLNPDRSDVALYIQLYGYRLNGESRPMFVLTRADGEWFDCYHDQAEALWDDAQDFDFRRIGLP